MALKLDPNRYDACRQYNDWLDAQYLGQYEPLNILSFQPRPSEVLFTMSPDTYQAIFPDFIQQRADETRDSVWNLFPSPIAYYFYRFGKGSENDLQRLHFLRDTWEATIDIIHALAVAEIRYHGITLVKPIKFIDLLTDKIAKRIENVNEIVQQLQNAGITPLISQIVSTATLEAIRTLNQSRNAFSHGAAQSELQARSWINECIEDVIDVLAELEGLTRLKIVRFIYLLDNSTLRCEVFSGHGSSRTFDNIQITSQQMLASMRYFKQGQMLAITDNIIFSLRPLIHYHEDSVGHTTRLCIFRQTHGESPARRIVYVIVGEARPHEEDRVLFSTELTELRAQFGLEPD